MEMSSITTAGLSSVTTCKADTPSWTVDTMSNSSCNKRDTTSSISGWSSAITTVGFEVINVFELQRYRPDQVYLGTNSSASEFWRPRRSVQEEEQHRWFIESTLVARRFQSRRLCSRKRNSASKAKNFSTSQGGM